MREQQQNIQKKKKQPSYFATFLWQSQELIIQ